MVSINTSANAAVLASIRQINTDLATNQLRIGTGKKVNSASDNSSVWSIAQSIRSDQSKQDGFSTGISLAKGRADTAVTAVDTVIKLLGQAKTLAAAANSSSDFASMKTQITALNAQITSTINSATFKGENWLNTAAAAGATVTIGYNGSSAATVVVVTADQTAITEMTDYTTATAAIADTTTAGTTSTAIDTLIGKLTAYQGKLSSFSSSLGMQQDFLKALTSIRDTAVGALVDADLTEESAKSTALQTQQQLAYQALSIGNSSSSNILRLFQ